MKRMLIRFFLLMVAFGLPNVVAAQTETTEYYVTDTIGSIRVVFDASGTTKGRVDYGPFGQEFGSVSGIPAERFSGQAKDGETDQAYFHFRLFQSRTGRFTQPDPAMGDPSNPQLWNRYAYALNNPVSHTDPLGLCPDGWNPALCFTDWVTVAIPDKRWQYRRLGGGGQAAVQEETGTPGASAEQTAAPGGPPDQLLPRRPLPRRRRHRQHRGVRRVHRRRPLLNRRSRRLENGSAGTFLTGRSLERPWRSVPQARQ